MVDPTARRKTVSSTQDEQLRRCVGINRRAIMEHAKQNVVLIVRGWVKTSAWALGAFQSEEDGFATARVEFVDRGARWRNVKVCGDMRFTRHCGPDPSIARESNAEQCIFVSVYKLATRFHFFWVLKAAAGPDNPPGRTPEEDPSANILASEDPGQDELPEVRGIVHRDPGHILAHVAHKTDFALSWMSYSNTSSCVCPAR